MTENKLPRVSVLGLGIMGIAIAENLYHDGYLHATWNRSPKADFPLFKSSIKDAMEDSEFILILVTDDQAVSDVINAIIPYLNNQHLVIQCSTVLPASNIEFERNINKTGAAFTEALIGGSKPAAMARKIVFYSGGEESAFKRSVPALEKVSANNIYIGETGKASAIKLAMNLNIAIQIEAMCESFAYAESAGIDADTFFNVLKTNTAWNRLTDYKEQNLRDKDFSAAFSVKNMLKDIRLALSTDKTANGLALLADTEKLYARAESAGMGNDDMISLYKLLTRESNI